MKAGRTEYDDCLVRGDRITLAASPMEGLKTMQASVTKDGTKASVKLTGRFDFNTHRDFRNASDPLVADNDVREVVIDFSAVDYLDSSALGMLLMLRDKAGGAGKEVMLAGVRGSVKQVLDIANFSKLFKIN